MVSFSHLMWGSDVNFNWIAVFHYFVNSTLYISFLIDFITNQLQIDFIMELLLWFAKCNIINLEDLLKFLNEMKRKKKKKSVTFDCIMQPNKVDILQKIKIQCPYILFNAPSSFRHRWSQNVQKHQLTSG